MQKKIDEPGIYLFDKPPGVTSCDVVRKVKPRINRKKIGHFGTLDPFASGLLVLATGSANRLSRLAHQFLPKTYLATGVLGEQRDTGDLFGKTIKNCDLTPQICRHKIGDFVNKKYLQRPPPHSAARHKGKRLYHYARRGISVQKDPVLRKIYKLEIVGYHYPKVDFIATVGSGTYIRTLWEDMAKEFGTLGYLESLRRTSYGDISVERARSPSDREIARIKPCDFLKFPKGVLLDHVTRFKCGNPAPLKSLKILDPGKIKDYHWVLDPEQTLLGLAVVKDNLVQPKINFKEDCDERNRRNRRLHPESGPWGTRRFDPRKQLRQRGF